MSAPSCRTIPLRDEPADKDEFIAPTRVAEALVQLVHTPGGGFAIGLVGGWGSGKSTILRAFTRQLHSDHKTAVFLFDAWAHQGDPLRRSFLERLIALLGDLGWISSKRWKETVEELAGRRKVEKTQTAPSLTMVGELVVYMLLLYPVGFWLLNRSPGQRILGFVILLTPLAIHLVLRIYARFIRQPRTNVLALLLNSRDTTTTTETLRGNEPTSVEFERQFQDLLSEALGVEDRRLVIALDNLDRVSKEDALSLLSTLQTFLGPENDKRSSAFQRLWVIIPFSPQGMTRLWASTDQTDVTDATDSADIFLEKLFQVRVFAPPLLLSDWRAHLRSLLTAALPDHDENQLDGVVDICSVAFRRVSPTPRALKTLVNQIGVMHLIHGDAIALGHLAYFEDLKRRHQDVVAGLLSGSIPEREFDGLLGDSASAELAAIHFGQEPDKARQLLMEPPLGECLSSGIAQDLDGLLAVTGATDVLLGMDMSHLTFPALARAGVCIEGSSKLLPRDRESIARKILNIMLVTHGATAVAGDVSNGIKALIDLARDPVITQKVLQHLASQSPDPLSTQEVATTFVQGLADVVAHSVRQLHVPADRIRIPMKTASDTHLAAISAIVRADPSGLSWPMFVEPDFVVKPGDWRNEHIKASSNLNDLLNAEQFWRSLERVELANAVTAAVGEKLSEGQPSNPDDLLAAIRGLEGIAEEGQGSAERELRELLTQGHLYHHLAESGSEDLAVALAVLAFRLDPALEAPPSRANAASGHQLLVSRIAKPAKFPEFVDKLRSQLLHSGSGAELLALLPEHGTRFRALVVAVLRDLAPDQIAEWVSEGGIGPAASCIVDASTPGHLASVLRLLRPDRLNEIREEFRSLPLTDAEAPVHSALLAVDEPYGPVLASRFASLDEAAWRELLTAYGETLELAIDVAQRSRSPLGLATRDALVWLARDVATGTGSAIVGDRLRRLAESLDPATMGSLSRGLMRVLIDARGEVGDAFFQSFATLISPDDIDTASFVHDVLAEITQKGSDVALNWVAVLIRSSPKLRGRFSSKDWKVLERRAEVAINELPPENARVETLKAIAQYARGEV